MPANLAEIEKHLWDAADELRANSKLKSSEYSIAVLGLIFLRYADHKFAQAEPMEIESRMGSPGKVTSYGGRRILWRAIELWSAPRSGGRLRGSVPIKTKASFQENRRYVDQ
jgi:type I restriction-modification system DNA methylase subunit